MAENIIVCPGCGKKFRVKDAAGSGSFQCTGCQATVTYGAAAAKPAAPAKPAMARPAAAKVARAPAAGGARGAPRRAEGAARPAARARPAGRARRGRGGDGEEAPPKKSNALLFAVIGGVAVVAIVVVVLVVMMGKKKPPVIPVAGQPSDLTGAPEVPAVPDSGAQPVVIPPPDSSSERPPVAPPPDDRTPGETPAKPVEGTGSRRVEEPADGNLYDADAGTLRALPFAKVCVDLEHLKDTPEEMRAEIDRLCADLVNYDAGADQTRAGDRLAEIGKPALPKMISAFLKVGDLSQEVPGRVNACVVDGAIRRMVGDISGLTQLVQMASPDKNLIEKTIRGWYVWWYRTGYKIEKFDTGDDEEEE